MTGKDAAALACRVLSVYAFLGAIGALQWLGVSVVSLFPYGSDAHAQAVNVERVLSAALLPLVIYLAAGIFLWCKAVWLADRMTSRLSSAGGVGFASREILTAATALVGLFVVVLALPHVCESLMTLWLQARYASANDLAMPDRADTVVAQLVAQGVQTVLGLWLLFGTHGIADFLQRERAATPAAR